MMFLAVYSFVLSGVSQIHTNRSSHWAQPMFLHTVSAYRRSPIMANMEPFSAITSRNSVYTCDGSVELSDQSAEEIVIGHFSLVEKVPV